MEVAAFCTATWQITPSAMAGKPEILAPIWCVVICSHGHDHLQSGLVHFMPNLQYNCGLSSGVQMLYRHPHWCGDAMKIVC